MKICFIKSCFKVQKYPPQWLGNLNVCNPITITPSAVEDQKLWAFFGAFFKHILHKLTFCDCWVTYPLSWPLVFRAGLGPTLLSTLSLWKLFSGTWKLEASQYNQCLICYLLDTDQLPSVRYYNEADVTLSLTLANSVAAALTWLIFYF